VDDAELGAAVAPFVTAVADAVVGQYAFDGDVVRGEPRDRSLQELDAVVGVLDSGELAVRESGVRVDRGVNMGVATASVSHRWLPAVELVTTAIRHTSEFLDVNVEDFTAATRLDPSDHSPGRAVHPTQPIQAVSHENSMHRRCGHPHDPAQASGPQLAGLT
jgi:hypothetical protein